METSFENAALYSQKHPKPDMKFAYGTAGFRGKASSLDSVVFRMGLLATVRSQSKQGRIIGAVITASHNPVQDNGVKLVDPMGEMLVSSWEKYATNLANADNVCDVLNEIVNSCQVDLSHRGRVFLARDTRPSGDELSKAFKDGVQALGGICEDFGILTTPQLHYMVRCQNTNKHYGEPTAEGYYKKLSTAFLMLSKLSGNKTISSLKIDGANGVGAPIMKDFQKYLQGSLNVEIHNDGSSGKLNDKCGADFVKVGQCVPESVDAKPGDIWASFDGDADRIVFFYLDDAGKFSLLDGDKIATLIAGFLKEKLDKACIVLDKGIGVVQTAYANGSSTRYVEDVLKVPVACVKTGVKHLHHKAEEYDVGVYFEANGHGTVLFSSSAIKKVQDASNNGSLSEEKRKAAAELASSIDLINQAIGDAISDMLIVMTILREKQWSLSDWNSCYTDLPNRQRKVTVKDRSVIETADAERKVTSPAGLQDEIDILVKLYKNGRSFVRPSGTEDIVRVYAEADTQAHTDELALEVSRKVYDLGGGVGDRP